MQKSEKNVLVTGATGFVGSHLVHRLISDGYRVHVLVRKGADTKRIADIADKLVFHEGDLTDQKSLEKIVVSIKPTGIFHLAAQTVAPGISAIGEEMTKNNLLGTINLAQSLQSIAYDFFVYSGSFIEYKPTDHPVKETDVCEPVEPYGVSKLAATRFLSELAIKESKPIVTLRFFTPYGPEIQKGKLIDQIISNALNNTPIQLTRPSIARDFLYIDDLVDLLIESAEKANDLRGEIFNAGSGVKTTIKELVAAVIKEIGSTSKIVWDETKASKYDSDFWQADMTKTFKNFSWRPQTSLQSGLRQTIEWFRQEH
ncbi:MAG: hypothetical protein A2664_00685 [Candidatus Taylorbacteria bacterium RIFCSPHIGHO2_01_FULL_46_22b]|uniref:NAD-dependent epimerase/dehydratase domain-containing protein n=1 Tax=Candidatus Taylorbacteria bacterium RIFCSPHIGHO2_01_FULL_46_22b TaxID=1802301 RepID=A0A1G2M3H1_9BACT|nr:MAG: hypothetical protein A2664_00685 [Candidatus Taylorbacteria bacterium RIFCSPHIGHO2_01_FULL_46_22b]